MSIRAICVIAIVSITSDPSAATCADPKRPYVEIDFSTLPQVGEGKFKMTLSLFTEDTTFDLTGDMTDSRKAPAKDVCATVELWLRINKYEVEIVDTTKLRVYGRNFNDKLIPATQGKVESPDLKEEQLPKIKNPPKA